MATSSVLVPCKSCTLKVPVGDLRRNKDGIFVCTTCLNRGFVASVDINKLTPERIKRVENKQPVVKEQKLSYYCNNCKFSFSRPLNSEGKGCPYCNKEHTVQRKESAQDLLKNVDDFFN